MSCNSLFLQLLNENFGYEYSNVDLYIDTIIVDKTKTICNDQEGYKWEMYLYNPSGVNLSLTDVDGNSLFKLQVKNYYLEDDEVKCSKYELGFSKSNITLTDGLIQTNNQIKLKKEEYIKIGKDLNINNCNLLLDKIVDNNITATTIFRLYNYVDTCWKFVDIFGTCQLCNNYFRYSLLNDLIITNYDKIVRRYTEYIVPSNNFNANEWKYMDINSSLSSVGDPHIKTISGDHYDYNYIGFLRYFDNNDDLIINIETDKGDYEMWEENDYIKLIYIKYKDKICVINSGFRGRKVKVVKNEGFNIIEQELEFDISAERYAGYSDFNSTNDDEITEYLIENPFEVVPDLIRNKLSIQINDNFNLEVVNVNKYNLQPCRLTLNIKNNNKLNKWTGLVISRFWSIFSHLDNLFDDRKIIIKKTDEKLPLLTKESSTYNKQWE